MLSVGIKKKNTLPFKMKRLINKMNELLYSCIQGFSTPQLRNLKLNIQIEKKICFKRNRLLAAEILFLIPVSWKIIAFSEFRDFLLWLFYLTQRELSKVFTIRLHRYSKGLTKLNWLISSFVWNDKNIQRHSKRDSGTKTGNNIRGFIFILMNLAERLQKVCNFANFIFEQF